MSITYMSLYRKAFNTYYVANAIAPGYPWSVIRRGIIPLLTLLLVYTLAVEAEPFNSVVVFGDSLSDAGILNNYSLGVFFSPTIQSLVDSYLKNNRASASTLYQMWGASNDIYAIYESAPSTATSEIIPVANAELSLLNCHC